MPPGQKCACSVKSRGTAPADAVATAQRGRNATITERHTGLTTIRRKCVSSISEAITEGLPIKRKHEFFGMSATGPEQARWSSQSWVSEAIGGAVAGCGAVAAAAGSPAPGAPAPGGGAAATPTTAPGATASVTPATMVTD